MDLSAPNPHHPMPATPSNMTSLSAGQPGENSGPENSPSPALSSDTPNSRRVSAKRAEQNRAAQRAFRERKQRYIKELEVKAALLDARNVQLQDSEVRHRDLRTMVERLTRERDVRIKERELWWREREEVFRIVDALRKDLEQLHGENERLKEVVFGLWQESREGSVAENDDTDISKSKESGAIAEEAEKEGTDSDASTEKDPKNKNAMQTDDSGEKGSKTTSENPSLGSISFTTLIERPPKDGNSTSTGNSLSDALLVDLKNRISYWDAEREALYRTAAFPPIPMGGQVGTAAPPTLPNPFAGSRSGASTPGAVPSSTIPVGATGAITEPIAPVPSSSLSLPTSATPASMSAPATGVGSSASPTAAQAALSGNPILMDQLFAQMLSASGNFNGMPAVAGMSGMPMPFNAMGAMAQNPAALAALAASGKLGAVASPVAVPTNNSMFNGMGQGFGQGMGKPDGSSSEREAQLQ